MTTFSSSSSAGGQSSGATAQSLVRVGLIGCGGIGAELVRQIRERGAALADAGFPKLKVTRIAVRDLRKPRPAFIERSILCDRPIEVASDSDIDCLVELAGGISAKPWIEAALHTGKPVITANKAVMADSGGELLNLAAQLGLPLRYEASVGGGIPVLRAIENGLAATRLEEIAAVVNGTTNYILTRMEDSGCSLQDALKEAQDKGYAEADPTMDIEGIDAAQKLVILTGLAFGVEVPVEAIPTEGITKITVEMVRTAKAEGKSIRLVARARRGLAAGDEPKLSVRPERLPSTHTLARISGVTNAISLTGEPLGEVVLTGPGAGPGPTATAVLSDILDATRPGAWPSRTWRELASITAARIPSPYVRSGTAALVDLPRKR